MVIAVEVFIAARRPPGDRIVVIHDAANVGAGLSLAVVTRAARLSIEVVIHAGVVANFVGENLVRTYF